MLPRRRVRWDPPHGALLDRQKRGSAVRTPALAAGARDQTPRDEIAAYRRSVGAGALVIDTAH